MAQISCAVPAPAKPSMPTPPASPAIHQPGDERPCPRCDYRTAWTGYGWEHCSSGWSGTLSCDGPPASPAPVRPPLVVARQLAELARRYETTPGTDGRRSATRRHAAAGCWLLALLAVERAA